MTTYPDHFSIVRFFGYPSYQQEVIASYNEYEKRGDPSVKRFFEQILERAEKLTNSHLMDNKIVFELHHNITNTTIYCGYKDNEYRISLMMSSESLKKLDING